MRGLWNLGNTCYFNTAIQCLAHVPPLTKHFFSTNLDQMPCAITREYQKVMKQLFIRDRTDAVSPSDLFGAFRVQFPEFGDGRQHDAQEVVLLLIDVFEKSLGKELVTDLFNGQEDQVTSWDGGSSRVSTTFTTLFLDVTEPCRLCDLLTDRKVPILIENYKDDQGREHTAHVLRHVTRWPKFTSFSFSMYDYKFPIEIPFEFEGLRLFACILHQGRRNGGHYALLVRRFDKWYIKDDERVTEVPGLQTLRGEFYQVWYRPTNSPT